MENVATESSERPSTRTTSVLALLAATALIFSYLVSYALTNVLVAANLMQHWLPGHDPRPRRMLIGFASLMAFFLCTAALARWISQRQLARIDQMGEEERGEGQGARGE